MNTSLKLLIIDDDEADRLHLRRSLKKSGFDCDVTECQDKETAIEVVAKESFDCIFLDYLLPGDNGLSLLKRLRGCGLNTPIVIITSQGSESIAVELMKAGASDYIVKNEIKDNTIGQILRNTLRMSLMAREHEEAVRALKVSEARLAEAQKIARIGNWEVDKNNNVVYWSDEVYNILGLTKGIDNPSYDAYVQLIHPEDKQCLMNSFEGARSGSIFNVDHRLVTSVGMKYANAHGYAIAGQDGELLKVVGTIQDITERKLAEEEILKARELAEDSLKIREVFLANMSHEIRTPMNAIIGFTQLLYETKLSQEQKSFVDAIHFSGENLLVIINDILDLSKIQSGKMTLEKIDFNLNDLLKGIINSLRRKAQEKGLLLTYDLDVNVPHLVKGDPVRLNQVLINLISNAIKFTERGYIHVQASEAAPEGEKFWVEFSVKDTGIGIPLDKQSEIFETFVQASYNTTRKYGGTGLGLAIVKSIVQLQGGNISVDSSYGYGSTFCVQLPFEQADPEIVQVRNQDITVNAPLHLLKRASILVVEDNHVNQLLVKRVLDKTGCSTDVVANGLQAIESVKSGKYDLVLMDIQMPEMDGYAATKHIRSKLDAPLSEIPIIAMTAHALASEVEKCISVGMNDYVSKPFKQEVLYSKITKHLKASHHLGIIPIQSAKSNASRYSIDLAPIYDISEGDHGFVYDLMLMYEKQTPEMVEKLRNAVQQNDLDVIGAVCHQIKSSYGIVSMAELSTVLEEVSAILKGKDAWKSERLKPLVNEVITLIIAITEEVKQSVRKTG